jgi:hypothetical protein
MKRLPKKTRMAGVFALAILFVWVYRPLAISMWRAEQAALPEGDLIGAGPVINDGKQHGFPPLGRLANPLRANRIATVQSAKSREVGLSSSQNLLKVKGNSLFNEAAVLKAWLDVRKPDAEDYVFNSQKSTKINRVSVYKIFKAIARKAGLGESLQHPHILKHTAAMLMVQQGANAFLIRQHLGHRSFDSTLAYVNPSDADASAASARAFNQVF